MNTVSRKTKVDRVLEIEARLEILLKPYDLHIEDLNHKDVNLYGEIDELYTEYKKLSNELYDRYFGE